MALSVALPVALSMSLSVADWLCLCLCLWLIYYNDLDPATVHSVTLQANFTEN